MRRAQVPFSPWDTLATTICVSLVGSGVPDVYGIGFPDAKQCSTLDHRQPAPLCPPFDPRTSRLPDHPSTSCLIPGPLQKNAGQAQRPRERCLELCVCHEDAWHAAALPVWVCCHDARGALGMLVWVK